MEPEPSLTGLPTVRGWEVVRDGLFCRKTPALTMRLSYQGGSLSKGDIILPCLREPGKNKTGGGVTPGRQPVLGTIPQERRGVVSLTNSRDSREGEREDGGWSPAGEEGGDRPMPGNIQEGQNSMNRCPPHHWMIAQPAGPWCLGRCKRCRQTQWFPTHLERDNKRLVRMVPERDMTSRARLLHELLILDAERSARAESA